MLTNEGTNPKGETHWSLLVPEEHIQPGLEVGIRATTAGLEIGGNLIGWDELHEAKRSAWGG